MPRFVKAALLFFALLALGAAAHYFFSSPEVANSPPPAGPIIAFGDSLTEGVGSTEGKAYPDQLSALLGLPVINRGVAGETARDALKRIDRDVLSRHPGVVVVLLGGNDLLQRVNPDDTFRALETIVDRCQNEGAMVVLIGIQGLPLVSADFGSRFKTLAREKACLYIPDIMEGIMGKPGLMSDQVHPNGAGYALVAEKIAKAIRPYLS